MKKRLSVGDWMLRALLVIVLVGLVGIICRYVESEEVRSNAKTNSSSQGRNTSSNDYEGWKTAVSARAGFSLQYPANWAYSSTIGANDNVEGITIASSKFILRVDSFSGKDILSGGQPATTCLDCLEDLSSTSFTVSNIGEVAMKTVSYKLDTGKGNALILELPDSTYYIPSAINSNVYTSFRGISVLDSEQAYESEISSQFMANPDYKVAQKILESLSY